MSMDEVTRDNILKTAEYVKQYGRSFEEKLLNRSDEKFAFLRPEHEYHAFYESLFRLGDDSMGSVGNNDERDNNESEKSKNRNQKNKDKNKNSVEKGREKNSGSYYKPARPKQLVFSSYDSNDVSSQALQIIQRTAEFCARSTFCSNNNKNNNSSSGSIIDLLRTKSKDDDTFDFLNPEHRLNNLFTNFLNQYKRILSHTNNTNQRPPPPQTKFLETCFKRAEYNEYMKYLSSRNTEIKRLYAIRFAAINWANVYGDDDRDSKSNSDRRRVIPMNLWEKHSKDSKKPASTALYMKPLDFKQLSKKNISTSLVKRSIEKYFREGLLNIEQNGGVTSRDNKKEKKRKGKFVVKEAGESRLKRKKQKR